jgi:hypothetical protein
MLLGKREQARRARIDRLVNRVTEPRDRLPPLTVLPHDAAGERLEITAGA